MIDIRDVPIRLNKLKENLDDPLDVEALEEAIQCYERQILEVPYDFFGKIEEVKKHS